jgi:hypothetical protein
MSRRLDLQISFCLDDDLGVRSLVFVYVFSTSSTRFAGIVFTLMPLGLGAFS